MLEIKRNDTYCYVDDGEWPFCSCHMTNKDQLMHQGYNNAGCYYIDKIFALNNVRHLAKYLKDYEIYDVENWGDLRKYGIDITIQRHFSFYQNSDMEKNLTIIPVYVCIKADDEFDHQLKYKFNPKNTKLFEGYSLITPKQMGKIRNAWAVLNTDDDNMKILTQTIVWHPHRFN